MKRVDRTQLRNYIGDTDIQIEKYVVMERAPDRESGELVLVPRLKLTC